MSEFSYIKKAEELVKAKDFTAALQAYAYFQLNCPDIANIINVNKSRLQALIKKEQKAPISANKIYELSFIKKEFPAIVKHALHALWAGFSMYAMQKIENFLEDSGKSTAEQKSDIYYELYRYYNAIQDTKKALDYLNQIPQEHMSDEIFLALTLAYLQIDDFENAHKAFQKLSPLIQNSNDGKLLFSSMIENIASNNSEKPESRQLLYINEVLTSKKALPLALKDSSKKFNLDNIYCPHLEKVKDTPYTVTVISTVYNREDSVENAIRSILDQTWVNLEYIIIDDASTDSTFEIIQKLAKEDERIIIYRNTLNKGCYPSRNIALEMASGDFITIQDSDDWSHPERLRIQVEHLIKNKNFVGNYTQGIYFDENMTIQGWFTAPSLIKMATVSFMFRRSALKVVSKWNDVRFSADSEFIWRIRHIFGQYSIPCVESEIPYYFFSNSSNSLTRSQQTSQLTNTNISAPRWIYTQLFENWHKQYPFVDINNNPYQKLRPNKKNTDFVYDRVIVADFSEKNAQLFDIIKKICEKKYTVGIFHYPQAQKDFQNLPIESLDFLSQYEIEFISTMDTVQTQTLCFAQPNLFSYNLDFLPAIKTDDTFFVWQESNMQDKERNILFDRITTQFKLDSQKCYHCNQGIAELEKYIVPDTIKNFEQKASVDIVIPVYNALHHVKACLSSIMQYRDEYEVHIIIANDCSDSETSLWLQEFCKSKDYCTLIEQQENIGYTKNVNAGLEASKGQYIVLLNSDTLVTSGWIQKMLDCFKSDKSIGIVGPLSNAGGYQSIPKVFTREKKFEINELVEGYSLEQMAELVERISLKKHPKINVLNGFCFMIDRKVINTIGYMDAEYFPIGYGEEVDYCIRATDAGFTLAIADNVYIFHAKSKSFGITNRKELTQKGSEALKEKYSGERYAQYKKSRDTSIKNADLTELRDIFRRVYTAHEVKML